MKWEKSARVVKGADSSTLSSERPAASQAVRSGSGQVSGYLRPVAVVSARGLWLELLELHEVHRPASHESPVLRNEAAVLV